MKRFGALLMTGLLVVAPRVTHAQVFTVTPGEPKIGDQLTVTYNPAAPAAALKGATTLKAEVMVMLTTESPVLIEIPLTRTESAFSGSFSLTNSAGRLLLFRVVSGAEQDNNNGNAWHVLVHGTDGKPLENANALRGSFLGGMGIMEFKHEKDYAAAYTALAKEKELYPGNWRAYTTEWSLIMRENRNEETKVKIKTALEAYYSRFQTDEEAVAAALSWFEQTGQKERGDAIRGTAMERNPKGRIAEATRLRNATQERDVAKRIDLIEKFLEEFPQKGSMRDNLMSLLVNSYVQAKQPDKALATVDMIPSPDPGMLNAVAWGWIEKGENLDQAVKAAKKGVDIASNPAAMVKPTYFSNEQWKEQMEFGLGMILDTYAFGLYQQGKYPEAEDAFARSYRISKGEQPDITERLLMAYEKNGKHAEIMAVGKEVVEAGKTSDKILAYYKAAYVKTNGSDKGFDTLLGSAKETRAKEMKDKVMKSRVNKPAIQFALKDTREKTVRLSDLKGKVVVVDFWATWCGPCKMSFPTLQKVYEKYRSNPNVAIYALNTWERVSGKERKDIVKKFLADNKYTFPVLYDEGFVDKFGVDGIPTKFIIDKKGQIAFKSVGFNNADEMLSELTTQIDMLVAE
jgi:thiol-disulfide isomerase/thioredoxin